MIALWLWPTEGQAQQREVVWDTTVHVFLPDQSAGRTIRYEVSTEADFMECYGQSDTGRALIQFWFKRRRGGTTLIVLGTVVGIAGYFVGRPEDQTNSNAAAGSAASVGLCIISLGTVCPPAISSPTPEDNGRQTVGTALVAGGATMVAGGIAIQALNSRQELRTILSGTRPIRRKLLAKALAAYRIRENVAIQRILSKQAATEEEARTQQAEYWRKRGITPPAPKQ